MIGRKGVNPEGRTGMNKPKLVPSQTDKRPSFVDRLREVIGAIRTKRPDLGGEVAREESGQWREER
jgi:hypothetical protein